jgi:hypothetical protein
MRIHLKQGESLTAVLGDAVQTTNPNAHVEWEDQSNRDTTRVALSGASVVTLLSSPNASGRTVTGLILRNPDTAAIALTLSQVVGGVSLVLLIVTLEPGYTLIVGENGIAVVDSTGKQIQGGGESSSIVGAASGEGVTAVEQALGGVWNRTTLTLADTPIVLVDEADTVAYGGLKIYDMPRGRIVVLSASADLAVAKTSAGVDDDYNGDFSMGTVVASNDATLTATEANIIPSTATPEATDGATTAVGASTAPLVVDGSATPMDVYFNALVDDSDHDVDGTPANLEFTGTIEIIWAYLGV